MSIFGPVPSVGWALALALITFPIRPVLIRASIAR